MQPTGTPDTMTDRPRMVGNETSTGNNTDEPHDTNTPTTPAMTGGEAERWIDLLTTNSLPKFGALSDGGWN